MLILILIQFVQMWNIFGVFTVNFKQVFFSVVYPQMGRSRILMVV